MTTPTKRPTVFVLDDHRVYLDLETFYLSQTHRYLVKKFNKGMDLLNKLTMKPDIVVLDYYLQENGKEETSLGILKKIKEENPDTFVVMLTKDDKRETIINCIKTGAYDYVVKNENAFITIENILNNISHVLFAKREAKFQKRMTRNMMIFVGVIVVVAAIIFWLVNGSFF